MTVEEIFKLFEIAQDIDDKIEVSRILELLEDDRYCNELDWNKICHFLKQRKLTGRLELITRKLITKNPDCTGKPYLVLAGIIIKSKQLSEVRDLLACYKSRKNFNSAEYWSYVNFLDELGLHDECYIECKNFLLENPKAAPFRILACHSLWKLGRSTEAKYALNQIPPILDDNSSHLIHFVSLAIEMKQNSQATAAISRLVSLVVEEKVKLSRHLVYVLRQTGFGAEVNTILDRLCPNESDSLLYLEEIFDVCLKYGAVQTAKNFGKEILSRNPSHYLLPEIENIKKSNDFLFKK